MRTTMISRTALLVALLTSTFMPMGPSFASNSDIIIIEEKEEKRTPPKSYLDSLDEETIRFLRNPHSSYDNPIELQHIEDAKVWMQKSEKYSFFDPLTKRETLAVKAEVIGEGNCAFTSMLLSRTSAIQSVIDQADNQFLRGLTSERFINNKRSFIKYFEDIQYDSIHYLMYLGRIGRDETGNLEDVLYNEATLDEDEISAVAFATSLNAVVLTYDPEDETRRRLYPTALFRNPKPINIRTAYIIFEGGGRHGNHGIHYNMIVPAERPADLTEEEYNTLIVQAKRRQDAAELWNAHVLSNTENESAKLQLENPKAVKDQLEHDNKRAKEKELSKKRKASLPEPKGSSKETKEARTTLKETSSDVPSAPRKPAPTQKKILKTKETGKLASLFTTALNDSTQLGNQSPSMSPRKPAQGSQFRRFTNNFSPSKKTSDQK